MALLEIAGKRGEVDSRILGNYLSKNRDRIEDGMRIEKKGKGKHGALWSVTKV